MQRREFMKWAGVAGATALFLKGQGPGQAQVIQSIPATQVNPYAPHDLKGLANGPEAYTFFTGVEARFMEAAVERILPADESGPGALGAGVSYYIDQQLAGAFGEGAKWYMQGPWDVGTPNQGYQLQFTPAEVYRAGISASDRYAQKNLGKPLAQLGAAQQDQVLKAVEAGKVSDPEVPVEITKQFFAFLLQHTIEGFLADPAYGGNRGKTGWQQIGYPGVYLEMYGDYIDKAAKDIPKLTFLSLADTQQIPGNG